MKRLSPVQFVTALVSLACLRRTVRDATITSYIKDEAVDETWLETQQSGLQSLDLSVPQQHNVGSQCAVLWRGVTRAENRTPQLATRADKARPRNCWTPLLQRSYYRGAHTQDPGGSTGQAVQERLCGGWWVWSRPVAAAYGLACA